MMTIDEAIIHAKEKAENNRKYAKECEECANRKIDKLIKLDKMHQRDMQFCIECAEEHKQLAEWLEELKSLREKRKYQIYSVEAEMYKANEHFPNTMVFRLNWTANLGFGELNFYYDIEKNEWECDSECMSKDFCKAVLDKWLEDVMKEK